jgi:hypothetical protein
MVGNTSIACLGKANLGFLAELCRYGRFDPEPEEGRPKHPQGDDPYCRERNPKRLLSLIFLKY